MSARKRRCLRHPRTTQEKRRYYSDKEYVRAKRRPRNLPDAWDDYWIEEQKNWKSKRKTQYRHKGPNWGKYTIRFYWNSCSYNKRKKLISQLNALGYYYKIKFNFNSKLNKSFIEIVYWGNPVC